MVELHAYSHVRMAATVVGVRTMPTLRVVVKVSFTLSADGTPNVAEPEEPTEFERLWLFEPPDAEEVPYVLCTATAEPWHLSLGAQVFEVDVARPLMVPADAWQSSVMATANPGSAEWIVPPRVRPHASLWVADGGETIPTVLRRVEFDRRTRRWRACWRGQIPLSPRDLDGRVVALLDTEDEPLPSAEVQRRTQGFRPEAVLWRSSAEEAFSDSASSFDAHGPPGESAQAPQGIPELGEETMSMHGVPFDRALPFDTQPGATASQVADLAAVPVSAPRLSVGQLLTQANHLSATAKVGFPAFDAAAQAEPGAEGVHRVSALWWAEDATRRLRRLPELREVLPRARRVQGRDAESGDDRTRLEIALGLERATAMTLAELVALDPAAIDDDAAFVVHGSFAPEFDEVATLGTIVAAVSPLRRAHPPIDEAAAQAELLLDAGRLGDAPGLAAETSRGLLEAVRRSAGAEAVPHAWATATKALVRGRRYAERALDGDTFVRARLDAPQTLRRATGGPPTGLVAYLPRRGAERLPLLRSLPVAILGRFAPPMEEGDEAPCLFVHAIARDLRRAAEDAPAPSASGPAAVPRATM